MLRCRTGTAFKAQRSLEPFFNLMENTVCLPFTLPILLVVLSDFCTIDQLRMHACVHLQLTQRITLGRFKQLVLRHLFPMVPYLQHL